ncbi:MAG: hypothetical protein H7Y00_16695 [Fimbriimonadaceae bacterium]|nr:hypothetical protein [Chitinophagales bacterium]
MAETTWQYANNQFDNTTKESFIKMVIISSDHDSKLAAQIADADINTIYTFYHPVHQQYITKYTQWRSSIAQREGATLNFTKKIDKLRSVDIEDWDIRVSVIYKPDTPEYMAIFPDGRSPFQVGSYESRILAVSTLIENMGTDAALTTIKTDVTAISTVLQTARNTQQGKEGIVVDRSAELEELRFTVAKNMFRSCAKLMDKFWQNPLMIEQFFDLETIRSTNTLQDPLLINLNPSETKNAAITFSDTSELTITNTGSTAIIVCRSATSGTLCPGPNLTVNPAQTITVAVTSLAASGNFINVTNTSAGSTGSLEILAVG